MGTVGGFPPITILDLQLYIIAQEIRFANWDELGDHRLRLGGFHVHEQVWNIFSKKYAASELEDILAEANVFGPTLLQLSWAVAYIRDVHWHKLLCVKQSVDWNGMHF